MQWVSDDKLTALGEHLAKGLGTMVASWHVTFNELTLIVTREHTANVMRYLRDDAKSQFTCLIDICGADYPDREHRFDVVYHLLSPQLNQRIRVKTATDDKTPVPSVTGVFPAADWFEREAFDMYGILFSGHSDLRRLLTDYGFEGYPLRKDFPLTGFVELRYSEEHKRVMYEPVKLPQEYRSFDYTSPWEGPEYNLPGDEKAADQGG
jgi:NADH-quinone oxidoreductase subunit C